MFARNDQQQRELKGTNDRNELGISMMPQPPRSQQAQGSQSSQPMVHDHELETNAPFDLEPDLQSKGFRGGVPLNTETSAVNPRADV